MINEVVKDEFLKFKINGDVKLRWDFSDNKWIYIVKKNL